ncbi:hypothetical protein [Cellulomonas denverensis]|uniref:ATPase n=1 Tax=Cellulomonas denverensis TaxID=264297 RepID=A0A7X6R0D0_9CELL|nr:hypothetical protein [Cellulomonas denverensis]NKY24174.1 hypothetical protein [Cellulomonas denverensis]GIG25352.1 hypothetical protein Cde04nite_15960 [Cellulomonas denverensis]
MTERTDGLTGVLDALEQAITHARPMPMSSSVLVSRAELLDLVAQARAAVPTEIADAERVLAEAAQARAAAREEGERIEAAARRRAEELVGEQAVVAQAEQRAAEIVAAAEDRAAELRREADDYCDRRLADFEIDLGKLVAQVQAGRAKLAHRLDDGV